MAHAGRLPFGSGALRSPSSVGPSIEAGTKSLGTVVLRPAHPLEVLVRDGLRPVAGVRIVCDPPSLVGGMTDLAGRLKLLLSAGRYAVRAYAADGRVGEAVATLPAVDELPLTLDLAPGRSVEVRIHEKVSGKPIAGAQLDVDESRERPGGGGRRNTPFPNRGMIAPTDADGRATIPGVLPDGELLIGARAAGFATAAWPRGQVRVGPRETQVEITLRPLRPLVWRVVDGERPRPRDGTRIALEAVRSVFGHRWSGEGFMEDGRLGTPGFDTAIFAVEARAPDGSLAILPNPGEGAETAAAVSFYAPRRVEILVRDTRGTPLPGWSVRLEGEGNYALAAEQRSDSEGRVIVTGLRAEQAQVRVGSPHATALVLAGQLDLIAGDQSITIILDAVREVIARVTIEGVPSLPAEFHLKLDGGVMVALVEDPIRAELRFELHALEGATPKLSLRAPGYPRAETDLEPSPAGPLRVELALRSAGSIQASIGLPEDGRHRTRLERWSIEELRWIEAELAPSPSSATKRGTAQWIYEPVPPGKYRLRDLLSGMTSEELELRDAEERGVLELDLSHTGVATGRVLVPDDAHLERTCVIASWSEDADAPAREILREPVGADGSFAIRLPGRGRVILRPWHPLLVPASPGGRATLSRPEHNVVLALVAGPLATWHADLPGRVPIDAVRYALFPDAPRGEPAFRGPCLRQGDAFAFGGFESGTWTLWLDPPGRAPLTLKGIRLGAATTDLGRLSFSAGSTISLRLELPESLDPARIHVVALALPLTGPRYQRSTSRFANDVLEIRGLGPGLHRLRVIATGFAPCNRTIELDGSHDAVLTIPLR